MGHPPFTAMVPRNGTGEVAEPFRLFRLSP